MKIQSDQWLSNLFGYNVFKIESGDALESCQPICDHIQNQVSAFYYVKVDAEKIGMVRALCAVDFYPVDANITFGVDRSVSPPEIKSRDISISEISPEYREAVLRIASTCFQYSRFHLDPLIPKTIANRIKHDWVLSYINKNRGEQLFVALIDGHPVGFIAVLAFLSEGKALKAIDLIGVDREFQNRGVGQSLVAFFVEQYRRQCDELQVGTQIANVPSMRLYEKLGFSAVKTSYILHRHIPNIHEADANRKI